MRQNRNVMILIGLTLVAALAVSSLAAASLRSKAEPAYNTDNLIRLHVVANSDSDEDQAIKRRVRDAALEVLAPALKTAESRAEARTAILENRDRVRQAALERIGRQGKDYDVRVELGKYAFPTKAYADLVLPAGRYEALRISIGEARGQNWWCVLYPQLCYVEVSDAVAAAPPPAHQLAAVRSDGGQIILVGETSEIPPIKVRSAILDWFRKKKIDRSKVPARLAQWLDSLRL